jgi:hypothetical protein
MLPTTPKPRGRPRKVLASDDPLVAPFAVPTPPAHAREEKPTPLVTPRAKRTAPPAEPKPFAQQPPAAIPDPGTHVIPPPMGRPNAPIARVRTRYRFPVYIASQRKTLIPDEICPVIVDAWVRNQLSMERGSLVEVDV